MSMTPERLDEIEALSQDMGTPGDARALIAALREAWAERDSALRRNRELNGLVTEAKGERDSWREEAKRQEAERDAARIERAWLRKDHPDTPLLTRAEEFRQRAENAKLALKVMRDSQVPLVATGESARFAAIAYARGWDAPLDVPRKEGR